MDKNTIIGTVLIGFLIIAYFFVTKPSESEIQAQKRYLDSIKQVEIVNQATAEQNKIIENKATDSAKVNVNSDSIQAALTKNEYGRYANSLQGNIEFEKLENELLTITFSNKGAKPYYANLKDYKTYGQKPLILFAGDSTNFGLLLSEIGKSTNSIYFKKISNVKTDTATVLTYRLYADSLSYIEYAYSLAPNSYKLNFAINTVGMSKYIKESRYSLFWESYINSFEKSKKTESQHTTVIWKYFEDDNDQINARASEEEKEELTGKVKWIAFKQHFFSTVLVADESFERGGEVISKPLSETDSSLKVFSAKLFLPKKDVNHLSFYIGPNHYPTLKAQGVELESLLDLGWFGFITKFAIIPIFNWLSSFLSNYGLIILLLTIILKMALFPLTYKSYLSTARMRVLKPQVDEINKKFDGPGEAMKRQQASMEMYRKAGVNPMGGCLPLLIQFPILIAMFGFFPASIELRGQSFLWAEDLSSYDAIFTWTQNIPLLSSIYGNHISLFTLLMAVSMIFVNQMNSSSMTTTPGMPNMKVMMWIMSIMMIFWFNNYSSGLSYYYLLANIITLLQTFAIRQMVDDKKILAKIESNKKNPKKKSSFQERLERMAKEQQKLRK